MENVGTLDSASRRLNLQQRTLAALQRFAPPSKLPPHLVTGMRGEQLAFFHIRRLGYTVVAERWTSATVRGDLDLVAWDLRTQPAPTLVIFEVKSRTARDFAPAETAVDADKKRQLRLLAAAYLRQLPRAQRDRVVLRFDLLSVYLLPSGTEFEHFPDAFGRHNERPGFNRRR